MVLAQLFLLTVNSLCAHGNCVHVVVVVKWGGGAVKKIFCLKSHENIFSGSRTSIYSSRSVKCFVFFLLQTCTNMDVLKTTQSVAQL